MLALLNKSGIWKNNLKSESISIIFFEATFNLMSLKNNVNISTVNYVYKTKQNAKIMNKKLIILG